MNFANVMKAAMKKKGAVADDEALEDDVKDMDNDMADEETDEESAVQELMEALEAKDSKSATQALMSAIRLCVDKYQDEPHEEKGVALIVAKPKK